MDRQQTLARDFSLDGVGVHSGKPAKLTVRPAPADTGLVFRRADITDKDNQVAAHVTRVSTTELGTNLTNDAGVSVATVEHFLAACWGAGLDNAVAELDGPELPILDGSSAPFLKLIDEAGLVQQDAPRRVIRVTKPVEIRDGAKWARLSPGEGFEARVTIDFSSKAIGRQSIVFRMTPGAFAREAGFARTFGFAHQAEQLHAMGKGLGASMDNTIVVEGDVILNPGGLQVADEFVRHKLLDVIGDLYLAGRPIEGLYEAEAPGHALNNRLLRMLIADPTAHQLT